MNHATPLGSFISWIASKLTGSLRIRISYVLDQYMDVETFSDEVGIVRNGSNLPLG